MFSKLFNTIDIDDVIHKHNKNKQKSEPENLFNTNKSLNEYDFLNMLDIPKERLSPYIKYSNFLTVTRTGKNIFLYNPVYLSDKCINKCTYCSFGKDYSDRKKLSNHEIEKEFEHLYNIGFRHILIVNGQGEEEESFELICNSIKIAKKYFHSISLEVGTYSNTKMEVFRKLGAESYILYQETYSQKAYSKYHINGPKKDFVKRLDTPDNAAICGFDRLGLGALLGLNDHYYEALSLFYHIKYMQKNYPHVEISLSLPRLCSIDSQKIKNKVSDIDIVRMIIAFRIAFPEISIYLSTRERKELRDNLIGIGITHMSAGAKTNPGGYTIYKKNNEQFTTTDTRNVNDIIKTIVEKGYFPVFKNWDSCILNKEDFFENS